MKPVTRMRVVLHLEGQRFEAGELVQAQGKLYFKYYDAFISEGLEISPLKLPLSNRLNTADTLIFDGLFGVFNDSLPDGWGRLLLDRWLLGKGVNPLSLSPLDRLSFVGNTGPGALEYIPVAPPPEVAEQNLELDTIARESTNILEGSSSSLIEDLVRMGGSSGGARPKIFVAYQPDNGHLVYNAAQCPPGHEEWIIKFPSTFDAKDIARVEYVYYQMAVKAGLEMSECRLFQGTSGSSYFGTKRFDRSGGGKIHLHSASGLMHDNFRLSALDYGHLMDAAYRLEKNVSAYQKILRLAAFNVYGHNRDDHSKNFAFLMAKSGQWRFSPVYDLTFSNSSHGYHSTTVAGEGKDPGLPHLMELARVFDIKNAKQIIEEVKEALNSWPQLAREVDISKATINLVYKTIQAGLGG